MSTNNRPVIGIVLQDKAAGSRELLVYPQDTLLPMEGELKPVANTVKVSTQDTSGSRVGEVTETNVIRAIYWGNEESDIPPDVVKNEEVELFFDENTNTTYWKSSGRTAKNRSRERKEFRSANQEGYVKELSDDNSYFIRIDTLTTKEIRIQTSMSDGEEFKYTILISPKENKLRISDDQNNEIGIDSKDERVFIRNKGECIVNVEKKSILIGAPEDITLKADRQIILNTPCVTGANNNADGCMVWKTKAMTIDAQEQVVIKAPSGVGLHAPVEATSIVSGPIQAEDYCTGKY